MDSRAQFTFYSSFARAAERIKNPEERCIFYDTVKDYALYQVQPDLDALPDIVAVAFELIQPTLDKSRSKAEAGKAGGESKSEASAKQEASKPQANRKQTESKRKADTKQPASEYEYEYEYEYEKENELENESYTPPLSPPRADAQGGNAGKQKTAFDLLDELAPEYGLSAELKDKLHEWLEYKRERREGYKPQSLKTLIKMAKKNADDYGEQKVFDLIDTAMANRYMGITWDRIGTIKAKAPPQNKEPPVTIAELESILAKM